MRRLALPVFLCLFASPTLAAPLYECTARQSHRWDDGALQAADHLAATLANGTIQFRLDPEHGLEYPSLLGERWTGLFIPVTVTATEGVADLPKPQLLASTLSGSDSIRIVTEGDTPAFVWTTWGSVETGTCTIIESATE